MSALTICTTLTSKIFVVVSSNATLIKFCILTWLSHLEMRTSMLYWNVNWDHQLMISRQWWTKLICCLLTSIIIIWSRWKMRKCAISSSCENSSLINWHHSSLRLFFERFYLNTKSWSIVSQSYQLASKFLSLSSNCLALTKFRIECTRKNVYWLKTCIHIKNK